MTCSWIVHILLCDFFTTCSRLVHELFMTSSWFVHNFFTSRLWLTHNMFTSCSLLIHNLFMTFSQLVHDLFMTCLQNLFMALSGLVRTCSKLFRNFFYNLYLTFSRIVIRELLLHDWFTICLGLVENFFMTYSYSCLVHICSMIFHNFFVTRSSIHEMFACWSFCKL